MEYRLAEENSAIQEGSELIARYLQWIENRYPTIAEPKLTYSMPDHGLRYRSILVLLGFQTQTRQNVSLKWK
jgi:hypothetical protein